MATLLFAHGWMVELSLVIPAPPHAMSMLRAPSMPWSIAVDWPAGEAGLGPRWYPAFPQHYPRIQPHQACLNGPVGSPFVSLAPSRL